MCHAEKAISYQLWLTGLMCVPSVPGNYGAVIGTACIYGYVFVFGWGNGQLTMSGGSGVGVSIVQVYEERDGKVVPKIM
jgi:hypothetical protein